MLYGIEGILGGKLPGATALGPIDRLLARKFFGSSGSSPGEPGEPDTPDVPVEKYSWEGVAQAIKAGTYKTDYAIGDSVPLDLGSEGLINMQVAAFDTDTLADGSGKAPMTFVAKELLKNVKQMNPYIAGSSGAYTEGTGAIGGWEKCEMRSYLQNTIKPMIPADISGMISQVSKTQSAYDVAGSKFTQATTEDVWIPDYNELYKTDGAYSALFTDNASRAKKVTGSTSARDWWMRGCSSYSSFSYVMASGSNNASHPNVYKGICLGFCVGKKEG